MVSNTEIAKSTTETSIKELGKSKKLMGELKEQSSQIINATIESARAGEAGKCY